MDDNSAKRLFRLYPNVIVGIFIILLEIFLMQETTDFTPNNNDFRFNIRNISTTFYICHKQSMQVLLAEYYVQLISAEMNVLFQLLDFWFVPDKNFDNFGKKK